MSLIFEWKLTKARVAERRPTLEMPDAAYRQTAESQLQMNPELIGRGRNT